MAIVDWSPCPLVEMIPGKVSGVPLLKNTRLPVDAITGNYDAFRDAGLSPEATVSETSIATRKPDWMRSRLSSPIAPPINFRRGLEIPTVTMCRSDSLSDRIWFAA